MQRHTQQVIVLGLLVFSSKYKTLGNIKASFTKIMKLNKRPLTELNTLMWMAMIYNDGELSNEIHIK